MCAGSNITHLPVVQECDVEKILLLLVGDQHDHEGRKIRRYEDTKIRRINDAMVMVNGDDTDQL
jgi:hypothetical protein